MYLQPNYIIKLQLDTGKSEFVSKTQFLSHSSKLLIFRITQFCEFLIASLFACAILRIEKAQAGAVIAGNCVQWRATVFRLETLVGLVLLVRDGLVS